MSLHFICVQPINNLFRQAPNGYLTLPLPLASIVNFNLKFKRVSSMIPTIMNSKGCCRLFELFIVTVLTISEWWLTRFSHSNKLMSFRWASLVVTTPFHTVKTATCIWLNILSGIETQPGEERWWWVFNCQCALPSPFCLQAMTCLVFTISLSACLVRASLDV